MALNNLTNKTFGKLLVIKRVDDYVQHNGRKRVMWECVCDCGNIVVVESGNLTTNHSRSCGCGVREAMSRTGKNNKTHGLIKTKEYYAWASIKELCYNKNYKNYEFCGAKGISVCEEWLNSFESFLMDVGFAPEGAVLCRINKHGNYEKSNVFWGSMVDVARSKSRTIKIPFKGEYYTIREATELFGFSSKEIKSRIRQGVAEESLLDVGVNSVRGIRKHSECYFYILDCYDFVGFGVSANISKRCEKHTSNLRKFGLSIKDMLLYRGTGRDCLSVETNLKRNFRDSSIDTGIEGFITEAIKLDKMGEVIKFLDDSKLEKM